MIDLSTQAVDQIGKFLRGKDALVTGGAGFMGSNLVHALIDNGARVTVLDNFHPDYGANQNNFSGIESKISLTRGDIRDRSLVEKLAREADLVFHVAAQCSHVDSITDPWTDLEFNCLGTLSVLEGCRVSPRKPAVIYAGTRAINGAPFTMPVSEWAIPNPVDIYGVNKHAAEQYGSVYARVHGVPFVSLRFTNCYGPRHQMRHGKYGIFNWFMSLALQRKPIKIFGTGEQLRDYLFVGDAVDAFLRAAVFSDSVRRSKDSGREVRLGGDGVPFVIFNVGTGKGIPFIEGARKIVERTQTPLESIPWPADRKAIETGDFVFDCSAAKRFLGWEPHTSLDAGLDATLGFYRENLKAYL